MRGTQGSVGGTTDVVSLSDQIQRYKTRLLRGDANAQTLQVDKRARCNETVQAQDALSDKCKRVVIENFALYPVHENTPAMSGSQYQFEFYTEIAGTCER